MRGVCIQECGSLQGLLEYNKLASQQRKAELESQLASSKQECSTLVADLKDCSSETYEKHTELEEQISMLSAEREEFAAALTLHSHLQERVFQEAGLHQQAVTTITTERTEFEAASAIHLHLQKQAVGDITGQTNIGKRLELTFANQSAEREACARVLAYHLSLRVADRDNKPYDVAPATKDTA